MTATLNNSNYESDIVFTEQLTQVGKAKRANVVMDIREGLLRPQNFSPSRACSLLYPPAAAFYENSVPQRKRQLRVKAADLPDMVRQGGSSSRRVFTLLGRYCPVVSQ